MRWIGPNYQAGFAGQRLVVIAEAWPREAEGLRVGRGLEAALVPGYLDESVKHRQLTDLARMVLGHVASREDCVQFYESVAMVNIPEAACEAGRPAIDAEWSALGRELHDRVEDLDPRRVLVLGERLRQELQAQWQPPQGVELCYALHPAARSFAFRDQWPATRQLRAPE